MSQSFSDLFGNALENQAKQDFLSTADKDGLVASRKTFRINHVNLGDTKNGPAWTAVLSYTGDVEVPEDMPTKMTLSADPDRDQLMEGILKWLGSMGNSETPDFILTKLGRKYILTLAENAPPF